MCICSHLVMLVFYGCVCVHTWVCSYVNEARYLLIEWLEIEADLKNVMGEWDECRILTLAASGSSLCWLIALGHRALTEIGMGCVEKKDSSSHCGLHLRSLITTLSLSSWFFAQPDMSRQIRRTHSPVIGFWGKVFRLTLGKGWLPSLVNWVSG